MVKTYSFWDWVDQHCPSSISKSSCDKCFLFSPSQCVADQNSCYSSITQDVSQCPYSICRSGFLNYFISYIDIIVYVAYAFIAFQFFLAVVTLFLLLHNTYKSVVDPVTRRRSIVRRQEPPKTFPHRRFSYQPPPPQMEDDFVPFTAVQRRLPAQAPDATKGGGVLPLVR